MIPQQLWDLNTKKGIWTINLHINCWKDIDFKNFIKNIKELKYVVDYEYIINNYYKNKLNFLDILKNKYTIKKNILISYLIKLKRLFNKIFI